MVLCIHLIGQEQHGGPQKSRSVSHLLHFQVKKHPAEIRSLLMLLNGGGGGGGFLGPERNTLQGKYPPSSVES